MNKLDTFESHGVVMIPMIKNAELEERGAPAPKDPIVVEDAARILGVSVPTVWRMARTGILLPRRWFARTVFERADVVQVAAGRGIEKVRR